MWAQVFKQVLLQAPRVIALVLVVPLTLKEKQTEKPDSDNETKKEETGAG